MYLEKMDNFFPDPALRTLDRCQYKEPISRPLNSDEKLLKDKIL